VVKIFKENGVACIGHNNVLEMIEE